jgi:hypothetical protein
MTRPLQNLRIVLNNSPMHDSDALAEVLKHWPAENATDHQHDEQTVNFLALGDCLNDISPDQPRDPLQSQSADGESPWMR